MHKYLKTKYLLVTLALSLLTWPLVIFAQSCPVVKTNDSAGTQEKEQIALNEELQGEASAQVPTASDYKIFSENNIVEKILANNIRSSEVTGYNYVKNPSSDLKNVGDCDLGSKCYMLENTNLWNDPSIEVSDGKYKPAWAFLQEVKDKAEKNTDSAAVSQVNSLRANYVGAAFNKFLKPNFDFSSSTSGSIIIPYKQFFDKLKDVGVEAKDPYMEFYKEGDAQKAKLNFAPSYPLATQNSAWLASCDFIVNSMLEPYKNAGFETSEYEAAIAAAVKNYTLSISKEDKNKFISFKYPINVLISKPIDYSFEYNIDIKSFPSPAKGYKTKIFIKPVSKKDDNIYILFGPFAESTYQFSWSEAISSGYINSNGQKAMVSSADYDLTFPQQYIFRVVTYDGDSEKDTVLATVQTQTETTASAATEVSDGNSVLKISAKPAAIKQGEKVTAKIEAVDSSDPANQISKVVLYACTGTASEVGGNDSSTCTYKNKDGVTGDAVKAAFTLGSDLKFVDGKATLSSSWDTSSSSIGNHALMAKAFRNDSSDQYIANSKTSVTIQITNSEVGDIGGGNSGSFGNLLAGQFNKEASENPTGSTIRNIGDLAKKIETWILTFIGVLAFFALVVGGFQYMGAGGDQAKAEKSKKTILYGMLGLFLAFLSYALVRIVIYIINKVNG